MVGIDAFNNSFIYVAITILIYISENGLPPLEKVQFALLDSLLQSLRLVFEWMTDEEDGNFLTLLDAFEIFLFVGLLDWGTLFELGF